MKLQKQKVFFASLNMEGGLLIKGGKLKGLWLSFMCTTQYVTAVVQQLNGTSAKAGSSRQCEATENGDCVDIFSLAPQICGLTSPLFCLLAKVHWYFGFLQTIIPIGYKLFLKFVQMNAEYLSKIQWETSPFLIRNIKVILRALSIH